MDGCGCDLPFSHVSHIALYMWWSTLMCLCACHSSCSSVLMTPPMMWWLFLSSWSSVAAMFVLCLSAPCFDLHAATRWPVRPHALQDLSTAGQPNFFRVMKSLWLPWPTRLHIPHRVLLWCVGWYLVWAGFFAGILYFLYELVTPPVMCVLFISTVDVLAIYNCSATLVICSGDMSWLSLPIILSCASLSSKPVATTCAIICSA